ncbi:hypothetical protein HG619_24170 [Pseudomonas syringae]|nr:hypothetical protein [Pseudomonas syringae]
MSYDDDRAFPDSHASPILWACLARFWAVTYKKGLLYEEQTSKGFCQRALHPFGRSQKRPRETTVETVKSPGAGK